MIDKHGDVVAHKRSSGPYKGIPIVRPGVAGSIRKESGGSEMDSKSHTLCQWPVVRLRRFEKEQRGFLASTGKKEFSYVKEFKDGSGATIVVVVGRGVPLARGVAIQSVKDPMNRRVGRIIARGRAIRALKRRWSSSMVRSYPELVNEAIRWWRDTFGPFKADSTVELTDEEIMAWARSVAPKKKVRKRDELSKV